MIKTITYKLNNRHNSPNAKESKSFSLTILQYLVEITKHFLKELYNQRVNHYIPKNVNLYYLNELQYFLEYLK